MRHDVLGEKKEIKTYFGTLWCIRVLAIDPRAHSMVLHPFCVIDRLVD